MAEEFIISQGTKSEKYALLCKQVQSLVVGEHDTIANMANVSAMIYATFGFLWVGFYRVAGNQLVLGPFQGPLACSRIMYGKGVCGTAWKERVVQCVADVDKFPGHIACSSASRSEVVVPLFDACGNVVAVLDIDSDKPGAFDECDVRWLQKIVELL